MKSIRVAEKREGGGQIIHRHIPRRQRGRPRWPHLRDSRMPQLLGTCALPLLVRSTPPRQPPMTWIMRISVAELALGGRRALRDAVALRTMAVPRCANSYRISARARIKLICMSYTKTAGSQPRTVLKSSLTTGVRMWADAVWQACRRAAAMQPRGQQRGLCHHHQLDTCWATRWGPRGGPPCWTSTYPIDSGPRRASEHTGPISSAARSGCLWLCASPVYVMDYVWQVSTERHKMRTAETRQAKRYVNTDEGSWVVVKYCYDFPLRSRQAPVV